MNLLFLCYGFSLALVGEELFDERVECDCEPLNRSTDRNLHQLYRELLHATVGPIFEKTHELVFQLMKEDKLANCAEEELPIELQAIIDTIVQVYGSLSDQELFEYITKPGSCYDEIKTEWYSQSYVYHILYREIVTEWFQRCIEEQNDELVCAVVDEFCERAQFDRSTLLTKFAGLRTFGNR
jgi:uncharacterized phage-associated protein